GSEQDLKPASSDMVNDASACSRSNLIDRSKGRTKVRNPYVKAEDKQLLLNGALLVNGRPTATAASEGVVVGACNHPHKLAAAPVRAGCLERHVRIPLLNQRARVGILRWHLQSALTNEDLSGIAGRTEGWSGAALEQLVRQGRHKARREHRKPCLSDLAAELPQQVPVPEALRRRLAVHEVGHALCAWRSVPESLFH